MNTRSVLVTGHEGYIGSVLTGKLLAAGYRVSGLDAGFFTNCSWDQRPLLDHSTKIDIRDLPDDFLQADPPDTVIHLAALSNDPLGELAPGVTEEINHRAAVRLMDLSREAGVKRFVYFSSQSMYGVSVSDDELTEDDSAKNPVTAYARTKWAAEQHIRSHNSREFVTCALRPSTVFGPSPAFRSDIIMNNMTSMAIENGSIELHTDGTPWRPIVHIDDVAAAAIAMVSAPADLVGGRAFNVGVPNGNYTVRQIAQAVATANSVPFEVGAHPDKDPRSYRVSFSRILGELSDWYSPRWGLESGANSLAEYLAAKREAGFELLSARTVRIRRLQELQAQGLIDSHLRWQPDAEGAA